jgi:nucleotide-binding universal stress UspA family protein
MPQFQPKHILCAVDLSPASAAVLSWARLFAEAFGARVSVVHANWSEPPRYFTEEQIEDFAAAAESARQRLRSDLESLARRVLGSSVSLNISVDDGHAVEVLLRSMDRLHPDLIVMGSHGHSGISQRLLGSVTENVVRAAQCPVLIVKGAELHVERKQLGRVVCPVNLTEVAADCTLTSSVVASTFGAELDVMQAIEESGAPGLEPHQRLCRWIPDSARRSCQVSELVLRGNAAEQVVQFARENSVDLLVIGAQHHPFLEMTIFGSTTERVMRHSPCSVLVVPRSVAAAKDTGA